MKSIINFLNEEPKRMSFKHKNNKALYYIKNFFAQLVPVFFYERKLKEKLAYYNQLGAEAKKDIQFRLHYYNKVQEHTALPISAKTLETLHIKDGSKVYFFDFYEYAKYFKKTLKVLYKFGDIVDVPLAPAFVKSRPIHGDNKNSVLLKWNKIRHFIYIKSDKSFKDKKDKLVFRGRIRKSLPNRVQFLEQYHAHPLCDIGDVNIKPINPAWQVKRMTISEQLEYKFILSLEGNDVASNLKWIMSSNSLVVMPKPKFETWYMEGTLVPNVHYALIADDFSDLDEKLRYYLAHPNEAEKIIYKANAYAKKFRNNKTEELLSLMVIQKYFEKTDQDYSA